MTVRQIFRDSQLQEQIESEGFVKVQLFDTELVREMFGFYHSSVKGFGQGDFLHTKMAPAEVNLKVHEYVMPKMKRSLQNVLVDYRIGFGYFIVKTKNGKEPMRVHQDKTLVDESKFIGLTIWCPLVDVTPENGGLSIVRKSHLFLDNHRGSNIKMPYKRIEDFVEESEFSEAILVKAGEAVIFDHRLWHASFANQTNEDRVVAAAVAVPVESSYIHYEKDSNGKVNKYKAGADFPVRFDVEKPLPPDCELVATDVPMVRDISKEDFLALYRKHNGKRSLLSKLYQSIVRAI